MNNRFKWTIVGSSTCVVVLLLLGAKSGGAVAADDVYGHLKVYTEVLERIKLEYVEEPDMKSVTLGAISGLLESVDPFASYLNADQYRQFEKSEDTAKAGIGVVLAKRYGYVAVVDTLPGSPAEKANISTGDLIESINNVATRDMPLAYAEQLLRGEPNSKIDLTVLRLRNPDPQKLSLTRTAVPYPNVSAKLMPNEVGYLHVTSLAGNRLSEVKSKLQDLKKQGAKYIVLDFRHCSTGEQETGIALANLFLDSGEITYLQGQKVAKQDFTAKPGDQIWSGPLVVITNRSTAGGAEIAAGALLDDKRAQVVGERSYGDAGLRKTIQMDDGSAVILSVAKYYSPSGKAIQDTGIVPTVQLAENDNSPELDQDGNPIPGTAPKNSEDNLLKQSIDLVTGKTTVARLMNDANGPVINGQQHPIIEKSPKQPGALDLSSKHMALYEYRCENCGEIFEVIQKFSDAPLTVHEKCGGKVERLLSAPAFQFKGSGWYVTDYARGGSNNATAKDGESKKADAPASTTGGSDSGASSSASSDKKASTSSDTK